MEPFIRLQNTPVPNLVPIAQQIQHHGFRQDPTIGNGADLHDPETIHFLDFAVDPDTLRPVVVKFEAQLQHLSLIVDCVREFLLLEQRLDQGRVF